MIWIAIGVYINAVAMFVNVMFARATDKKRRLLLRAKDADTPDGRRIAGGLALYDALVEPEIQRLKIAESGR